MGFAESAGSPSSLSPVPNSGFRTRPFPLDRRPPGTATPPPLSFAVSCRRSFYLGRDSGLGIRDW
ncbi:hypothetical protein [Lysobacter gummosus]|uniref:hypothetical protein n=1 Tax=Lysobacter gummosus TaxID=262324 RepID=UPI0036436115